MSAATLHPDEKYKAGKTGQTLTRAGLAGFVVLLLLSMFFSMRAPAHYDKTEQVVDQLLVHGTKEHPELKDHPEKIAAFRADAANAKDIQKLGDDARAANPDIAPSTGLSRFYHAYLIGWAFILSIALGSMLFVLIHHAVKAKWSVTTRRLAEILSQTMPIIFLAGLVFAIPAATTKWVFYWGHPDAHFPDSPGKETWMSGAWWFVRYIVYFAIWIGITSWFAAKSRKMDEVGDVVEEGQTRTLSARMRRLSYPMIIVFALSVNYAGFDFLMGTAPHWFSTIYSVNFFGGCMMAAYASISLFAWMLQRSGRLTRSVNAEHYQDLGKMLFAFTFFWTYTAFSQFMLIWYANMAEETVFYNYRLFSDWQVWSWVLLFCQFAIPFVSLLSRWTKRILPVFVAFCLWQLTFHWVDLYWNVMPHFHWGATVHATDAQHIAIAVQGPLSGPVSDNHVDFNIGDVLALFSLLLLFVAAVGRNLKGNLLPIKDPNLGASLAHENY
jgi:hypothetical protein